MRRCLGTQNPPQNHFQKGLEGKAWGVTNPLCILMPSSFDLMMRFLRFFTGFCPCLSVKLAVAGDGCLIVFYVWTFLLKLSSGLPFVIVPDVPTHVMWAWFAAYSMLVFLLLPPKNLWPVNLPPHPSCLPQRRVSQGVISQHLVNSSYCTTCTTPTFLS